MRLHRFYVLQPLGEDVVVSDVSLYKQWTKVLRYSEGDFVILYNGDGYDYTYTITNVTKNSYTLRREGSTPAYIPEHASYLFVASIKKDTFELVAEKATECGVTHIIPIHSSRTEKKNLDTRRLTLILKEASEQSGRGDIPTLTEPMKLQDAVTYAQSVASTSYVGSLHGKSLETTPTGSRAWFIGPEGGWTEDEEELFIAHKCVPVSFGKTVLRAETAAIIASMYLGKE